MLRLGIAETDDVPEERAEQTRSPGAAELCPEQLVMTVPRIASFGAIRTAHAYDVKLRANTFFFPLFLRGGGQPGNCCVYLRSTF